MAGFLANGIKPLVSKALGRAVNLGSAIRVDRALRELLLPPVCLVCGGAGEPDLDCCSGCQQDLPLQPGSCRRCGISLPLDTLLCGHCSYRPPPFDSAFAAFEYRAAVAGLIQRFKFGRDLAAGRVLAGLTARELACREVPRPDLMVPVPLHSGRRRARGFNQAAVLTRDLAAHFGGLPWFEGLRRTRSTATQSELPAQARGGNVRGAFDCAGLPSGTYHVALVDDVMTTGSTVAECARVLKRAGAGRVDIWVIARA